MGGWIDDERASSETEEKVAEAKFVTRRKDDQNSGWR